MLAKFSLLALAGKCVAFYTHAHLYLIIVNLTFTKAQERERGCGNEEF